MRRTEALQGVRMTMFFKSFAPLGIGGAQSGGGGGVARGERADIPALDAPLRGGRRGRAHRPAAQPGVGQAGPERSGGRGGTALPRALPGFRGQAFPRASGEGPRLRLMATPGSSCICNGRASCRRRRARGAHRRKRERRPLPGMMLHQDGSRHEWLEGQPALDLIVMLMTRPGRSIRPSWSKRKARPRPSGR
jgi:hypothetical protein